MEQSKTFAFKNPNGAESDIPTKIINENFGIFAEFIESNFSYNIEKAVFPDLLKMANIKPIYKKISRNEKSNYKPVSILPNLSKTFENILSTHQCGFRKGFIPQHGLLKMFENSANRSWQSNWSLTNRPVQTFRLPNSRFINCKI